MSWNRPNVPNGGESPTIRKGKPNLRGILAAGIVIAGAGVAWYLVGSRSSEKSSQEPKAKLIHSDSKKTTSGSALPIDVAPAKTNRLVKAEEAASAPEKPKVPPFEKKPGQLQLPNGKILTFPVPTKDKPRLVYASGHTYECDYLGNFKDITKRPLFHTAFEQNFLRFAQSDGGGYIPAFLKGLPAEEVKKMLVKNYQPLGDETPEEMAALKAYDDMRCAALSHMEEGGSFDDFIDTYTAFDRKQRIARVTSIREITTLVREGKIAEAKQVAEAASIMMERNGYKPLSISPRVQAEFDKLPGDNK